MKALPRMPYPGGVDGDGHIMEPPDLWERYLEAPFRERALRIRKDPADGLEFMEIDPLDLQLIEQEAQEAVQG